MLRGLDHGPVISIGSGQTHVGLERMHAGHAAILRLSGLRPILSVVN